MKIVTFILMILLILIFPLMLLLFATIKIFGMTTLTYWEFTKRWFGTDRFAGPQLG